MEIATIIVSLCGAIAAVWAAIISSRTAASISQKNVEHNEKMAGLQSQLNQLEKIAERKFTKKADTLEQVFMHVGNIYNLMEEYCVTLTTSGRKSGRPETLVQISTEFEKLHDFYNINKIYIPTEKRDILSQKIGKLMGIINQFQNTGSNDQQAQQSIIQTETWPIIKEIQELIIEELDSK